MLSKDELIFDEGELGPGESLRLQFETINHNNLWGQFLSCTPAYPHHYPAIRLGSAKLQIRGCR
ncbi:MAG: hypothetical protein ABW185_01660 [Sedimenticola sp.]